MAGSLYFYRNSFKLELAGDDAGIGIQYLPYVNNIFDACKASVLFQQLQSYVAQLQAMGIDAEIIRCLFRFRISFGLNGI